MSNSVVLRFRIVKNNHIVEASFDRRLSFLQNIELLNMIIDEKIGDFYIYDPLRGIFLDRRCPIECFNIESMMMFDVFT